MSNLPPLVQRYLNIRNSQPTKAAVIEHANVDPFHVLSIALEKKALPLDLFIVATELLHRKPSCSDASNFFLLCKLTFALLFAETTGEIPFCLNDKSILSFNNWVCSFTSLDDSLTLSKRDIDSIKNGIKQNTLGGFLGQGGDVAPIIYDDGRLFFHKDFHAWNALNANLLARQESALIHHEKFITVLESLVQKNKELGKSLTTIQQSALRNACFQKLSFIGGGPGTGKTFLIVSLVQLFLDLEIPATQIQIAAPTGKSVDRIASMLNLLSFSKIETSSNPKIGEIPIVSTIHRLLGYNRNHPFPKFNSDQLLEKKVLIVDEASMIGNELLADLFAATPQDTHTILIGDHNQLSSIKPGGFFQEQFQENSQLPKNQRTVLQDNFRMNPEDHRGARILEFSRSLLNRSCKLSDCLIGDSYENNYGVAWINPKELSFEFFLRKWFDERSNSEIEVSHKVFNFTNAGSLSQTDSNLLDRAFQAQSTRQILCPHNEGILGTIAINQWIGSEFFGQSNKRFYPGCQIMVIENIHELNLWNGTQGIALQIQRGDLEPKLEFAFKIADGWKFIDAETMGQEVRPSHAITVHKSQGSEYEKVILVIPPEMPVRKNGSKLLYTGSTRAAKSLIIVSLLEDFENYLQGRK